MAIVLINKGGTIPELMGLSSDTKPTTSMPAGALFTESDTGKQFKFSGAVWFPLVTQTSLTGSLANQITLLDAQTAIGYGPPLAMGGLSCSDFSIKGVALTALTVNFYKVSPSGGLHPLICNKDNADGSITLASSTSALPTAGTKVSTATPSTNISGATSPTFRIAINSDVGISGTPTYQSITLVPTGLTTGLLIASAMQVAIRALGGIYSNVTVTYASSLYTISSDTQGSSSKVRIAAGTTNDVATALKIVSSYPFTDGTSEAWHAEVPAGWTLQLGVSAITGTSVTASGTAGVK